MTNALVIIFVVVAGIALWLALVWRERYLNYRSGEPYRLGVIELAKSILFDDTATKSSQIAGGMLLATVYDPALVRLEIQNIRPTNNVDLDPQIFTHHTEIIRRAIQLASILILLEDRRTGTHFRHLIEGGDGQSGHELAEGVECFPRGKWITAGLQGKVLSPI